MAIQHDNDIDCSIDIALLLCSNRFNDETIHDFLRKMSGAENEPRITAKEVREILQKEMGERNLSDEIRRLRDEE